MRLGDITPDEQAAAGSGTRAALLRGGDYYGKTFWTFLGKVYEADAHLVAEDIRALVNEKANKKQARLDRARAAQDADDEADSA